MIFVQHTPLQSNSDLAPLNTIIKTPLSKGNLVIRLPLLPGKLDEMSPKMEQIVRMNRFRINHCRKFQRLSDREIEVLTLLANGRNNPQIAKELFLSRQTVETHRKNIKSKLELKSFLDLMRYAFAFDLVEV